MNAIIPESSAQSAAQMQNRALNFAAQIERMQGQLDQLLLDIHTNNSQVSTLTEQLTSPQSAQPIQDQLAELAAQVDASQTQMDSMAQSFSRAVNQLQSTQGQLEILSNGISRGFTQVESRQGQLESLSHTITNSLAQAIRQEDLDNLATTLKKFSRTQFKANALGESKEQQISDALNAVREIATKREEIQERHHNRDQEQIERAHSEARGELAAELLPALDSLERAIENGYAMIARQDQRAAEHVAHITHRAKAQPPVYKAPSVITKPQAAPTFWQRLFGAPQEALSATQPTYQLSKVEPPTPPAAPEFLTEAVEDVSAWLQGLELVHERFLGILGLENINPIQAVNELFDPRLHIAIEAVLRDDIPSQTIVRELRKGYRQGNRVLRYSEVIVAKGTDTAPEPVPESTPEFSMAESQLNEPSVLGFMEQSRSSYGSREMNSIEENVIEMPSAAESYNEREDSGAEYSEPGYSKAEYNKANEDGFSSDGSEQASPWQENREPNEGLNRPESKNQRPFTTND